MKKKLLSVLLIVLVLALGMQTEVYAAENSEMYTGISSITSTMGIYDSVLDFSVEHARVRFLAVPRRRIHGLLDRRMRSGNCLPEVNMRMR